MIDIFKWIEEKLRGPVGETGGKWEKGRNTCIKSSEIWKCIPSSQDVYHPESTMYIPQRCCDLHGLKIREINERNDQLGVRVEGLP